jgi:hypothetical protein
MALIAALHMPYALRRPEADSSCRLRTTRDATCPMLAPDAKAAQRFFLVLTYELSWTTPAPAYHARIATGTLVGESMATSCSWRVRLLSALVLQDTDLGSQSRRYRHCDSYSTTRRSTYTATIKSLLASSAIEYRCSSSRGIIRQNVVPTRQNHKSKRDIDTKATRLARTIRRTRTKYSWSSSGDRYQILHVWQLQTHLCGLV